MVLYELLCIARADLPVVSALKMPTVFSHARVSQNGVKEIARSCGQLVLRGGGVVRTYEDWGTMILPKRIRKHQTTNVHGRYWLMHFDTNPAVVGELRRTMSLDPRIVRANLFKLGDR